ncbi:MAG: dinitrogenase iron-molybdenum cofactor biosynthesis protein [Lachnospiraceae bacterium]|nr:dinitrogenase iron-molybdenum cofactor biosynthesis protein [Lachnospiraceae bacterium]
MQRVALSYEDGHVSESFGNAKEFRLYDIEYGKIIRQQSVKVSQDWYQSIAEYLVGQETDVVICGQIGRGARSTFAGAGVKVYGGVTGDADKTMKDFLDGSLVFNPMAGMT